MIARVLSLLMLGVIGAATSAQAMIDGKMSDARWFEGVPHKMVVLEFDSPGGASWGKQLAQLVGRLSLGTVRGLEGFPVITLRQEAQRIVLTPETVEALARKQGAAVVVWGEFYEQKGRIFVTSHLRYVPAATHAARLLRISWDASRLGIPGLTQAGASVPTAQVNFSPMELSTASLTALEALWKKSLMLREEPRDNATLSGELSPDTPYYVLEASGDWTKLKVKNGGAGWVRLTEFAGQEQFKEMGGPSLYSLGLLQHFAANHAAAATSFNEYLTQYAGRQDPMNRALAHLMLGYSYYLNRATNAAAQTLLAMEQFRKAAELLPNAAAPANCLALTAFARSAQGLATVEEMRQLERSLVHVIQTENDVDAVRNLQALYQLPNAAQYFKSAPDFSQVRTRQMKLLQNLERQFQGNRTN